MKTKTRRRHTIQDILVRNLGLVFRILSNDCVICVFVLSSFSFRNLSINGVGRWVSALTSHSFNKSIVPHKMYCATALRAVFINCLLRVVLNNTEVTKSQRNRRRQRRLQIFLKNFTFEAWKINVK